MTPNAYPLLLSTLLVPTWTGCTGEGSGDVAVSIWGEEYIEQGIPAAAFEDGGAATYTKFLVAVGTVDLSDSTAGEGARFEQSMLFDLVSPGPHTVGLLTGVSAITHDDFEYTVAPASAATVVHASATDADADAAMMASEGYSVYVEGSFTVNGDTKAFSWGFTARTRYDACVDVSSGQELAGLVVVDGGSSEAQLTIHGDHLFYDDLQSPDALLRAEALAAADADADGVVTMAELDAVKLADIPAEQGPFGIGASDVNDLGAYVRAATGTLGHFNGEGHCEAHHDGD